MNVNSIITKVTLIFVFTIALLIALFIFYLKYEKEENNRKIKNHHETLSNYLFQNKPPRYEVINYFESLNFELEQNHREVLHNGRIVAAKRGFETIVYKKQFYIHILTPRFRLLFKDFTSYKNSVYGYGFFILILCLLIGIYVWLIKSLKPLSNLKNQISKFAQGDLEINCKSNKKDEIADVANEFDHAVQEIKLLMNSRQLFLRTVMHELKTPIAKGRIVSELILDEKQKNRMSTIFEKLDYLINDFAKIEQVVSKNYNINRQNFNFESILDNATGMLMLEHPNDQIKSEIHYDLKLQVDLDLMSMAIKNLIDNALKYSHDSKVFITVKNHEIHIISTGDNLNQPLEEYLKPFHNDTNSKNHGMGLGLYIVYSILVLHDMKFGYEYTNNQNIFKIYLDKK